MTRQRDVKKSNFTAQTTVSDNAYFDFVLNGQNYKITKANLLAALGVTGSIEQDGEVNGTPILDVDGSTNKIRNLIDGPGITTSVSTGNGAKISHNFTSDTTGAEVLINSTSDSPTIRSIVAGSGISVGTQNGSIQVALSATPVTTKTVIINEIGDFPTPVGGVITLEPDSQYLITNDISSANRFVLQANTVITGADGNIIELEYTGSGTMFTSINNSNAIRELTCKCSNGTLFDVSCASGTCSFRADQVEFICDQIGTFDGLLSVSIEHAIWTITTDGAHFLNNATIINFFQCRGTIAAGDFIDLGTSTASAFSMLSVAVVVASGANFLKGASGSANINAGGLGTVFNCRVLGAGTSLSGITAEDAQWEFTGNNGIPLSRTACLATNAGATITIAATDTPVILGATWVLEDASRFTGTAGGRFTYTGNGDYVSLHASITAESQGGTDECTFYFFKNGTEITNSGVQRALVSGNPGNLSLLWGLELETGDYIEIFAENNNDTSNIIINNAIIRID